LIFLHLFGIHNGACAAPMISSITIQTEEFPSLLSRLRQSPSYVGKIGFAVPQVPWLVIS
jgi:hypothetical protein